MNASKLHENSHSQSSVTNYVTSASSLLLIIFGVLIGLLGNGMICLCMWRIKSLRTPVNNLILNMAVIGILASVTCLPIEVPIVTCQSLGVHFADTKGFIFFVVFLHSLNLFFTSVQLLTLASISFERYQAIAKPFEKSKRSRRVRVTLLLTWSIATGNWLSYVVTEVYAWNVSHSYVDLFIYDKWYFIVGFLPFISILISIITALYYRIVCLVIKHIKKTERSMNRVTPFVVRVIPEALSTAERQIPSCFHDQAKRRVSQAENNLNIPEMKTPENEAHTPSTSEVSVPANMEPPKWNSVLSSLPNTSTAEMFSVCGGNYIQGTSHPNNDNREQGKRKLEAKTAKLAGIVIVIFLILWLPYQVNILLYFHKYGPSQERWTDNLLFSSIELLTQTLAIWAVCTCPFAFAFVNIDMRRETNKLARSFICRCK